jgi:hypothetical protein
MPPIRHPLSDGRWHLQHGPIDLVIGAAGAAEAVHEAHEEAWRCFQPLLADLVAELPALRQPVVDGADGDEGCPLRGPVARRMWLACHPHRRRFITPMAAVAGAVAEEVVAAYARDGVDRAWVNNGGDIALHLAAGQALRVGVVADIGRARAARPGSATPLDGRFEVTSAMRVRGVATSGWRGRSFSLGIADSVTVLAATAAAADAAATMIANAVDADDARIVRRPASSLKDDTDLGELAVTVGVPALPPPVVQAALDAGARRAHEMVTGGLIEAALLACQGQFRAAGAVGAGTGAALGSPPAREPAEHCLGSELA